MGTLHLAPGDSAAGSLYQTFREAGLNQETLSCPDDLSCGPIRVLDSTARTAWRTQFYNEGIPALESQITAFWRRLATSGERLIAWIGRGSAKEHAFLLAVAHELGDRPFSIIDVAKQRDPPLRHPESGIELPSVVSILPPALLHTLIGTECPVVPAEHATMRGRWRTLQQEDAPFRITTGTDLVSVSEDYFDAVLMSEATTEPRKAAWIIGRALCHERADMQVGDLTLLARLVALVKAGKLIADGDPWNMHACIVRLPC